MNLANCNFQSSNLFVTYYKHIIFQYNILWFTTYTIIYIYNIIRCDRHIFIWQKLLQQFAMAEYNSEIF